MQASPTTPAGITVEDLRAFLSDKSVEFNILDGDLTWSTEELYDCMRRCAMQWNAIPPYVLQVNPNNLPHEYPFLLGSAYQAYLLRLQDLQRQDFDFNADGVQANLVGKRISHFGRMLSLLSQEFTMLAAERKNKYNFKQGWGWA